MANHTEILVENLKETLKGAQNYLLIGNGAALFLLLLAVEGKLAKGAPSEDVSVPYVGLSASTFAAAFIALAIYVLSGLVVLSFLAHSRRIQKRFAEADKALLEAMLTYPSLLTTTLKVQLGAALMPGILGALSLLVAYYSSHGFSKAAITGVLFALPYWILTWSLWSARAR